MSDDASDASSPRAGAMERTTELRRGAGGRELVRRTAILRVAAGPESGASALLDRPLVVGSADSCGLVLSDPLVSRAHLEVAPHDLGYLVRDRDSLNGTFYRGAQIHEALLGVGAELRVGSTVLRIERGPERSLSIDRREGFGTLVGSSAAMQEVFGLLAAVAPTETTVLLLGETGTGKELAALEIHRSSSRADKPFLVLDCGAIPGELVESELFGHDKGAFTGASTDHAGIFEQASGGTVFLDEIGELPLAMQTRLLRVLDQRTVKRVGSTRARRVEIRVVAATHRDLPRMVREGSFREDLYYRLSVVEIRLPPLRERLEDVPLLARHFLRRAGCNNPDEVLTPRVLEVLATRAWPGNARELRNVVERAVVLRDGVDAFAEAKAPGAPRPRPAEQGASAERPVVPSSGNWLLPALPPGFLHRGYKDAKEELLSLFERAYLERLVASHGSNISRIAADAEVDRHLVRNLLRKHGLLSADE
jgi:DNA-binding NtrC family response regulator